MIKKISPVNFSTIAHSAKYNFDYIKKWPKKFYFLKKCLLVSVSILHVDIRSVQVFFFPFMYPDFIQILSSKIWIKVFGQTTKTNIPILLFTYVSSSDILLRQF